MDNDGPHNPRGRRLELVLPVPEGDEPPGRRRLRSSGGFSKLLIVGASCWSAGPGRPASTRAIGSRAWPTACRPGARQQTRPTEHGGTTTGADKPPARETTPAPTKRAARKRPPARRPRTPRTGPPRIPATRRTPRTRRTPLARTKRRPRIPPARKRRRTRGAVAAGPASAPRTARGGPPGSGSKGLMAPDPSQLSAPPPGAGPANRRPLKKRRSSGDLGAGLCLGPQAPRR